MTGDDDRAGSGYDQPRVPTPLREQVDELFVAERGYEPASFQEALSVVVDLATDSIDGTADPTGSPVASSQHSDDGADAIDEDIPSTDGSESTSLADVSLDPDGESSVSFDDYVEGLAETKGPSPGVESILDTEHADGVVRELAAEVLDEMTRDAFQELEHGVDHGVGTGVTDGMGATRTADGAGTAPSGDIGDGVPDSLTADPESDCAVCGRGHPVSVLQTTILEEDGSVALVCPSCAE